MEEFAFIGFNLSVCLVVDKGISKALPAAMVIHGKTLHRGAPWRLCKMAGSGGKKWKSFCPSPTSLSKEERLSD
jgi:hypothetical protein